MTGIKQCSGPTRVNLMAAALCALTVCSTVWASATVRRVDELPIDRFDDYLAGTFPLHPWEMLGSPDNGVTLTLTPEGESPFCDNKETGKGLVCHDSNDKGGHGVGLGCSFTPPPEGDIYLGFDFKHSNGPKGEGVDLSCRLKGRNGGELDLSLGRGDCLMVKDDDGKAIELYTLRPDCWYHLGVTIRPDGVADFVIFDFQKNGADCKKEIKLPSVKVAAPEWINRLEFFSRAPDSATGGWVLDNVCMAGQVLTDRAEIRPFTMAPLSELRKSPKKVFNYYFVYGSGHSSQDPGLSWYTRSVGNPTLNTDSDRAAAGTKILHRPLPRPPMVGGLSKEEQRQKALEEEVRLAIHQGVDGFLVDFWEDAPPGRARFTFQKNSFALLDTAEEVGQGFKIVPAVYSKSKQRGIHGQADIDADPVEYASCPVVKRILAHPAVLRTPDGRVVFSRWLSEIHTAKWWAKVAAECEKNGTPIAFVPFFNSYDSLKDFAPISYGMAHWGPRTPKDYNWIERVRKLGVEKCVSPIVQQDVRTRGCSLWEAENSRTLRSLWMKAINDSADWTFIISWNDFSEQAMQPSSHLGFVPYDLNAYYTQWYKTGRQPRIIRDTLYYSHRQHHCDVEQLRGDKWIFRERSGAKMKELEGLNNIELLAFLAKPGTLKIDVAGRIYQKAAPEGITSFAVPFPKDRAFVPEFSLVRDNKTVITGKSRFPIMDKVEYPNMLYCSGVLGPIEENKVKAE